MILHPRVITGSGGGPDKTILNSPRFLKELGFRSTCLFLRPPADDGFEAIRQRGRQWSAPIEEIDDHGALDWRIVPKTIEICRRLQVDIWHGHDYKTNLLGLLVKRWHPMKLVTTVHGWVRHTKRTPMYYWLDRWAIKHYQQVLCVSGDLVDRCRESGIPDSRLRLIENAIDTDQFQRQMDQAEAKRSLGLPPERFLIGAVGRLSVEKGFDMLIRSVARLIKDGKAVSLVIVGDGDQQKPLESLIGSLGVTEHCRLVGFQQDPRPWYEAMDLYALSSLREGLPNTILEAMATRTPIVATEVAGVPKIIRNEHNGLIVPIDDEDRFTEAIKRLVDHPGLRERLANTGREVIETRYSFARRMESVAEIYRAVLQAG